MSSAEIVKSDTTEDIATRQYREKIIRTLSVFPELSHTMLHMGIGPSTPSTVWKPILEQMIDDGTVIRFVKLHNGKTYHVLKLTKTPIEHTLKNSDS